MKKLLPFVLLITSFYAHTQTFTEDTTINIADIFYGDVAWGDYDNDGDLDVLVTGRQSKAFVNPTSKIYTNNGGTFTELTTANLTPVHGSAAAWGDYDNDGDLDLLLTGLGLGDTYVTKIYTNNSGTFTELTTTNLSRIAYGDAAWGDYDNDGDLDIALTGAASTGGEASKIYTNTNGTFTELVSANLPGLGSSALAWGDYDNDGDLDLLLTGYTGSLDISKIYTNTNGVFTEDTSVNLTGVSYSSVAWGDYDNDGDLDILVSGFTGSANITKIYTNTAGSFTELATANLPGQQEGSIAWGDYDNDGDLDVLIAGSLITRIYVNTAGVFTQLVENNLPQLGNSDGVWGDYDNDGDLDIALSGATTTSFTSKIFTNNSSVANTIPTAPTNPTVVVNGAEVTLSWTASTDTETPSSGLSYNVYIKDAPAGSAYEVSPMAQENDGWRKLPAIGNAQQNTSYTHKFPEVCTANYTFKVQAIDHNFAGSYFSTEGSFSTVDTTNPTVITQDITVQLDTTGHVSITPAQIDNGSSDTCGIQTMSLNKTIFNSTNIGANTVTLTVTDVNGNSDSKTATVTVQNIFADATTITIADAYDGDLAWGDYDNDGDLDLLLTGRKSISAVPDPISKLYTNNGGTFTELSSANLIAVERSAAAWGDYDNDGDLDLLLTGLNAGNIAVTKIYTNNSGTFTELATANLPGITSGDVAWGDYDNDGDLDIALTGSGISKIYTNTNGAFTELVSANLPGLGSGALAWGDYDNDGDLDVVLTGYTGSLDVSKIYTNTNGVFTEHTSANLTGVSYSSVAWGDYDNDGDLDILVSGFTGSANITKIYTNTAGSFTELATANLPGITSGDVVWGDYDNDGDLDVLIVGNLFTRIYINTAGVFTRLLVNYFPKIGNSNGVWGDYDNDGDLDMVLSGSTATFSFTSKIFKNNSSIANTAPTAPTNPTAVVNGNEVSLSWTASTDAQTPSNGLSYNIYIKENPIGTPIYINSPMAQENDGWRKLPAIGNAKQNTSYIYKFAAACTANYTFKVQAIDHNFAGSAFSTEGSFSTVDTTNPTVVTQNITVQLDATGSVSITPTQIDTSSSDNCSIQSMSLDTTSFDCTKVGANTVSLTITDVNGNSDTKTATVTVEDKVIPTVITQNIVVQLDATGNVSITPAQINNGSSDICGIQTISLDKTTFDCTNVGANTVSLTVTDVNGNSDTKTATVTVEDKVLPAVITQNITVQLDVTGNVSITPVQINNGSSDNCSTQSMSLDITSFDCTKVGTNTVNLTVTDVNGNSDTKTATVTVEDKGVPMFLGSWGTGTQTNPFTTLSEGVLKYLPNGRYYFSFNNTTFQAELDNDVDGGGWLMILNYVHIAGDNSDLQVRNTDLPLLDSSTLGDNEASSANWGHVGNTLAVAIDFKELRFYGKTTGHSREIHFKTQYNKAIDYVKIGIGNFHGMNNGNYTSLSGHTSNLPQSMNWGFSDQGDLALTNFPFYLGNQYHWGIRGNGSRWEVDDFVHNTESTIHRVWVRGDNSPVARLPLITVQIDATGNATIAPTDFGLTTQDNCGGTITQTLSKTNFDCTNLGENTIQINATDTHGNTGTIDALVIVEDPIAPVITCASDITVATDSGKCEATVTLPVPVVMDNCTLPPANITGFTTIGVKGGSTYYVSNADFTGPNAFVDARVNGGYVATIESAEEDKFINDFQIAQGLGDVLIGFYNPDQDGAYIWHNEASNAYTNWNRGEPNNLIAETYGEIISSNGLWNNISENVSQPYILEIKGGIERTDALAGENIFPTGNHTITQMVTDIFGNTDTCSYTLTIEDKVLPTVVTQNITVQLDASGTINITPAQINNGSSDICGIQTISLDKTTFDCTNVGANTVSLTVTDVNGNSDTKRATVTVEDKVLPTVITQNITVQLDATGNVSITPAQIDNGSSDNCGIQTISLDITSFDCTKIGANTVSLTVTDVNGNSDTKAATVTVEDKVLPTVVTQNITVQLDAIGNVSIAPVQIDN
ncbi:FG-GAP-like repeat-containing protein, partial [Tenacibaculum sp.]|nr:FG-GAP-like repeat-containing protein [Tenacibaculum sp.]